MKLFVNTWCRLTLSEIIKHMLVLTDNNDAQFFLSYALEIKSITQKQINKDEHHYGNEMLAPERHIFRMITSMIVRYCPSLVN